MLAVDPAYVRHLWPHARHHLAPAFEHGIGDLTLEAVERAVFCGAMLLWVAWADGRVIAAVTTELVCVPRGKLCVITCGGGEAMRRWLKFLRQIERYAKAEGCNSLRVMGRKGWEKMLPGYVQPFIVLDKAL